MPIAVSGLIVVTFFAVIAKDWSGPQTAAAGAALAFVWTACVVVPLLILASPAKKR